MLAFCNSSCSDWTTRQMKLYELSAYMHTWCSSGVIMYGTEYRATQITSNQSIYIHTYIQEYKQTNKQTNTNTYRSTYIHTGVRAHTQTLRHVHTYTHIQRDTHTQTRTDTNQCTHAHHHLITHLDFPHGPAPPIARHRVYFQPLSGPAHCCLDPPVVVSCCLPA